MTAPLMHPPNHLLTLWHQDDEYDNHSYYDWINSQTSPSKISPSASCSTNEHATLTQPATPSNPLNTNEDETEPITHALDQPPIRTSEVQENTESCTALAVIHTGYLASEWDTTQDSEVKHARTLYPPGPPGEPPPDTNRTPAPPPPVPQEINGLPDADGITYHKNGTINVTVKCAYCHRQQTTEWSEWPEPYKELVRLGWTKGKNRSNNYNWKFARCMNCRAPDNYTNR